MSCSHRSQALEKVANIQKGSIFKSQKGYTLTDRVFNIRDLIITSSVHYNSEKPSNTSRPWRYSKEFYLRTVLEPLLDQSAQATLWLEFKEHNPKQFLRDFNVLQLIRKRYKKLQGRAITPLMVMLSNLSLPKKIKCIFSPPFFFLLTSP